MPTVRVPTGRDLPRIRGWVARSGVPGVALTPLLTTRVFARTRIWRISVPILGILLVSTGILAWLLATGQPGSSTPLVGLTVCYLLMQLASAVTFGHMRRVDRRIACVWPRQSAPPGMDDVQRAVGGWYIASWVLGYYGTLTVGIFTVAAVSHDAGTRLVVSGFVAELFLFACVTTATFLSVARRPSIGGEPDSRGDLAVRVLDIRLLFFPYPALLAHCLVILTGFYDTSVGSLHRLYAAFVMTVYAVAFAVHHLRCARRKAPPPPTGIPPR